MDNLQFKKIDDMCNEPEKINELINKLAIKPTRKIFYTDDNNSSKITAGGIIFYRYDIKTDKVKLLLQFVNRYDKYTKQSKFQFEDIGGRTEDEDTCIQDTIIRELVEETNGLISKDKALSLLENDYGKIYCHHGMYMMYVVQADSDIIRISTKDYGDKEFHTDKNRSFSWVDAEHLNIGGKAFNQRIWFIRKEIMDYINMKINQIKISRKNKSG